MDITPDFGEPIPVWNLPEQDEWRDSIEANLDGEEHRYSMDVHMDAPIFRRGHVVGFERGEEKTISFYSNADNFDQWKRDYFEAVRNFIADERVANDGESATASVNAG